MRLVEEGRSHVLKLRIVVTTIALAAVTACPARADVLINPNAIDRPEAKGDQLIFYYDARANFTTFLNLHNDSGSGLDVEVLFYNPTFNSPFTREITLDAHETRIVDVSGLKTAEPALAAQFGVAIATAVNHAGKAIVTRALSGNFTVANLQVGSAWGAPAAARTAVFSSEALLRALPISSSPDPGTVIDGTTVVLPPIQPTNAHLAVYYNPETLAPASLGGNQLIFIAFEDVPGEIYSAQVAATTWSVAANRNDGASIGPIAPFVAGGVSVSDLVSIAGTDVNGASGSMSFNAFASAAPISRFIFFTETLGTFATGYLLPPTVPELL
jgi:hypothetical protein